MNAKAGVDVSEVSLFCGNLGKQMVGLEGVGVVEEGQERESE